MKCVLPGEITVKKTVFFTCAFVQAMFGALTLVFHTEIFNKLLNSQLVVQEGTEAYNAWVSTPIPVFTKFYFFTILNAEDFLQNNAKPIVEERGPYTFREREEKVELVWNSNSTVSYRRRKTWWFERNMSVGPLTDSVITLNLPMVGAAEAARGNFLMEWGMADMLNLMEAQLFINRTVGELLFDGYSDDLIEMGDAMSEEEGEVKMPMDKFGWFYKRNGTTWSDGDLSMHTGEDNIALLGQIDTWNRQTATGAYTGECSKLRGSADGLMAPGFLAARDTFEIWSTDLCRPLAFTRTGKEELHGIDVDKFQLDPANFANTTVCQANNCYHNNLPNGVQNVTRCKVKSPSFVSRPHFYMADNYYQEQFQLGIHPDAEKHESYFIVEPISSIPLKVSMRLQLNILLNKNEAIPYVFSTLPRLMYPIMWFESDAELPEHMSGQLSLLVNLPVIMKSCGLSGVLLGTLGMVAILLIVLRLRNAKRLDDGYSAVEVRGDNVVGVDAVDQTPIVRVPLVHTKV